MRRRHLILGAAVAVGLIVAVPAGRWQAHRANAAQARGVESVLAVVGDPLASPLFDAYRLAWSSDCLLYRAGEDPFAIELCFDPQGRLVDAIDRRGGSAVVWSFRPQPAASPLRIDPQRLFEALRAAGAFPERSPYPGALPVRFSSRGPAYRGIAEVLAPIGGDLNSVLLHSGHWRGDTACLEYGIGTELLADLIEICIDRDGNLVRSVDRRLGGSNVSTFARDPSQQRYRVALPLLLDILERVQLVAPGSTLVGGRLPIPARG